MSEPNPQQAGQSQIPKVLDQLKEIKGEATELRNFTITFLSLLLYVNLIIAGTDAEQILRIAPVTLPLLNVPLPLIGFYGFLPWLLLFFHLYLLVQHYLFSQQLFRFDSALKLATPEEKAYARRNLGNLPFLHWMLGGHHSVMQHLLTFITLVSLIVWPLVTLLWLQMAILPYHSPVLLAWQRAAILLDVLLIGWLWPKTLDRGDCSLDWWGRGMRDSLLTVLFGSYWFLAKYFRLPKARHDMSARSANIWLTVKYALPGATNASTLFLGLSAVLLFSLAVATLPDSWEEKLITGDVNGKTPKPADSFWLKTVDVERKPGKDETSRMAFAPTAWLHEQHAKLFDDKIEKEKRLYEEWRAKGAKPCPTPVKPEKKSDAEGEHAQSGEDNHQAIKEDARFPPKSAEDSKQNAEKLCLMVQPWLPRNLILREKVLTVDAALKPELEARFKAGAAVTKPEELDQIRGLDLQNRNFDYADFSRSSLPKADLRYSSLKHAILRFTRLDQTQLISAHLDQANMSGAQLPGADLSHAQLPGANLSRAQLPGVNLSGARLPGADLSDAQLPGADLSRAQLPGANLSGAHLPGLNLSGAHLPDANVSYANLSGANLSRAHLPGANLSGVKLPAARLSYAQLPGANLSRAQLQGANLSGVQLSGADLSNAILPGANLQRAKLTGANLPATELSGANLYGAELSGNNLLQANLLGANLRRAVLHGAVMSWANLSGADMSGAFLAGANLSSAELSGVRLLVDAKPLSQEESAKSAEQYRQALALRSDYQGNQQKLEDSVNAFAEKVRLPPDFSQAKALKPCIWWADTKALLSACVEQSALDETSRKALTAVWVGLACEDKTEGHWVARRMMEMAAIQTLSWAAKPLQKAAKDPNCSGLAGMPEVYKKRLQALSAKPKK